MEGTSNIRPKLYEITNQDTGERRTAVGTNAQGACESLGWQVGDCYCSLVRGHYKGNGQGGGECLFEVPCEVCSFQFAACTRLVGDKCPCSHENPDLKTWLQNVTTAHLCQFVGLDLAKNDHRRHRKLLTFDHAVRELSSN